VQILYDGIPKVIMQQRAKRQFRNWFKKIKQNYKILVAKDDFLKNVPEYKFYEMAWLMDGMSKYYNPFQKNKKRPNNKTVDSNS